MTCACGREREERRNLAAAPLIEPLLLKPLLPPPPLRHSEAARRVWRRLPPEPQAARPARAAFDLLEAVRPGNLEKSMASEAYWSVGEEGAAAAELVAPLRMALRVRAAEAVAAPYRIPEHIFKGLNGV